MPGDRLSRRQLIRRLAAGSAAAPFTAALAPVAARAQAAKSAKTEVKYQYTPKGADHCGACVSFLPDAESSGGPGTCKAVEGPIPQNGWCLLFSRRR